MLLLSKTIIYRIYSLVILLAVSFAITKDVESALKMSISLEFIKLLQYYVFEHIWKVLTKEHV